MYERLCVHKLTLPTFARARTHAHSDIAPCAPAQAGTLTTTCFQVSRLADAADALALRLAPPDSVRQRWRPWAGGGEAPLEDLDQLLSAAAAASLLLRRKVQTMPDMAANNSRFNAIGGGGGLRALPTPELSLAVLSRQQS